MNREQPPVNDIELLSAYIDGELSAAERIELNNRLENEPTLQAELESLRETVDILNSLPTLKAPRDFRLDPVAYGRKSRRILNLNAWRVVSAVGVAAAVILIAGSLAILNLWSDVSDESPLSDTNIAFDENSQTEDQDRNQTEANLRPEATTLEFESDTTNDTGNTVPPVEQAAAEGDFADNGSEVSDDSFEEELDDEAAEEIGKVATDPGSPSDEPPLAAGAPQGPPTSIQGNAPAPGQNGMGGGQYNGGPSPEGVVEAPEALDFDGEAAGEAGRSSDAGEERDDDRQTQEAQPSIADAALGTGEMDTVRDLPIFAVLGEILAAIVALLDLIFSAITGR